MQATAPREEVVEILEKSRLSNIPAVDIDGRILGVIRYGTLVKALEMALRQRRPDNVVHHYDQGSQYTSIGFGARCQQVGVRPSMGSVGDCYDNAMCESFFATLECELIERTRFTSQAAVRMAVFEFIEGWYNPRRRHSAIG